MHMSLCLKIAKKTYNSKNIFIIAILMSCLPFQPCHLCACVCIKLRFAVLSIKLSLLIDHSLAGLQHSSVSFKSNKKVRQGAQ
jgi:hypothetical protein